MTQTTPLSTKQTAAMVPALAAAGLAVAACSPQPAATSIAAGPTPVQGLTACAEGNHMIHEGHSVQEGLTPG